MKGFSKGSTRVQGRGTIGLIPLMKFWMWQNSQPLQEASCAVAGAPMASRRCVKHVRLEGSGHVQYLNRNKVARTEEKGPCEDHVVILQVHWLLGYKVLQLHVFSPSSHQAGM